MPDNYQLALRTLDFCFVLGVREIVLASGSRNSPLSVAVMRDKRFVVHPIFEERVAGFFALGRIRQSNRPVVVMTTSGTAVAELLPAVIEGFYSGLPLGVISADRPLRFQHTGAPQAILQDRMFGPHVGFFARFDSLKKFETEMSRKIASQFLRSPWHLNLGFDEPLVQKQDLARATSRTFRFASDSSVRASLKTKLEKDKKKFEQFLLLHPKPLVILGSLNRNEQKAVFSFVRTLGSPVIAEALSGLREESRLQSLCLKSGDRLFQKYPWNPERGVLRLGGVPTCRFWRNLDHKDWASHVLSVDPREFSGVPGGQVVNVPFDDLSQIKQQDSSSLAIDLMDNVLLLEDARLALQLQKLLVRYPNSEPGLFNGVSKRVSAQTHVYLGNSLPIREWDLAANRSPVHALVSANRGANGIDGQLATFFGTSLNSKSAHVAVLGDLTTLYDASAPVVLEKLGRLRGDIVVVNNGGGRIFSRLAYLKDLLSAEQRAVGIENAHSRSFRSLAQFWGADYLQVTSNSKIPKSLGSSKKMRLIEVGPDSRQTDLFWKQYEELFR